MFTLSCDNKTRACAWLGEGGNRAATRLACWNYSTTLHYLLLLKQKKTNKILEAVLTRDLHRLQQFPTLEILSDNFCSLLPRRLPTEDGICITTNHKLQNSTSEHVNQSSDSITKQEMLLI
jgi:hypothetical protein